MFSSRKLILVIVLLFALSAAAYVIVVVIPTKLAERSYEGAKKIGRDISKAFQFTPQITVKSTVVLMQQTPILELATVSQKFQHQYDWTNTWLGSTKKIKISGTFEAKAGFNLKEKFSIDIIENRAFVTLPPAQILSVELIGDVKFQDEYGVWNWIDMEDRAKAVNSFQQDARKYAERAEFIQQAELNLTKELRQILALHGKEMEISFSHAGPIE
jgi:hypothetical protein